jgi:hypothetical protein
MSEKQQEPEHVAQEELENSEVEPLPDRKAMSLVDVPGPHGGSVTLPIEPPPTE